MNGTHPDNGVRTAPRQPLLRPGPPGRGRLRRALPWLVVYGVALALIAFWPQHVSNGMEFVVTAITRCVPILTYARIEFGANILLFVPLGILPAILLPRRRYLIIPIGFLISLTIESMQAVVLSGRTSSASDLIANTAGACIGLLIAACFDRVPRTPRAAEAKAR